MRIAYIITPNVVVSNRSNGIRSQALQWAAMLRELGHEVDCVDNWGDFQWQDYDVIHFFSGGAYLPELAKGLQALNGNLVFSPIIDPFLNYSKTRIWLAHIAKYMTFGKVDKDFYNANNFPFGLFRQVFVRSAEERQFIRTIFGVDDSLLKFVPLSYSKCCKPYDALPKERFCLHISSLYQPRKNVIRLIEAAKKYDFRLVLAGNKGNERQFAPLKKAIGNSANIEVLGFIDDDEMIELYRRAQVFALPSLCEGVGIVALDAAYYGCEIAITNISGPKEYYDGMCMEVDPLSVDSIGSGIRKLLDKEVSFQPDLAQHVRSKYSTQSIGKTLADTYELLK